MRLQVYARREAAIHQERQDVAPPLSLRRRHEDLEPVIEVEEARRAVAATDDPALKLDLARLLLRRHVDQLASSPEQSIAASVLYLFDDPALGGTAFYRPKRPAAELLPMIEDSSRLPPAEFSAKHGVAPGYMTESNDWYEKVASVPAAYNRLIVYSGTVFHSGEIAHPERLSDDPAIGRLTINGFFTCRRRAR